MALDLDLELGQMIKRDVDNSANYYYLGKYVKQKKEIFVFKKYDNGVFYPGTYELSTMDGITEMNYKLGSITTNHFINELEKCTEYQKVA